MKTPSGAVNRIKLGSRSKQPLLASLLVAMESFESRDITAGLNQLGAFQNKVRALIAPQDAALANELLAAAQQIIGDVNGRRGCLLYVSARRN